MNAQLKKLSSEFIVAIEIYKSNLCNEPLHFRTLVDKLDGKLTKSQVSDALDILVDWGIAIGMYNSYQQGDLKEYAFLFEIDENHKDRIRKLYENINGFKDGVEINDIQPLVEVRYLCAPVIIKNKKGDLVYSYRWDINKDDIIGQDDPSILGKDIKYE